MNKLNKKQRKTEEKKSTQKKETKNDPTPCFFPDLGGVEFVLG